MGANYSASLYRDIYDTSYNSSTRVLTNVANTNSQNIGIDQKVTIVNMGNFSCGGSLTITQSAELAANILSQLNSDQIAEIKNSVIDSVQRKLIQDINQQNEKLNFGQTNAAITAINIVTNSRTQLESSVETSISNVVRQNIKGNQEIYIIVGEGANFNIGGNCEFRNSQTIEVVASSITDNVLKVLNDNTKLTEALSDLKLSLSQKNVGVDPTAIIIAVIICIVCFLIIAGIGYMAYRKFMLKI